MGLAPLPSLRTPEQFQTVMQLKPCAKTAHFAVHALVLRERTSVFTVQSQLGLVIPKRHARRAVTRNLIKRQIRAFWAQPCHGPLTVQQPVAIAWVVRLTQTFDPTVFVSASSDKLKAAVRTELIALRERTCNQMATLAS